MPFIFLSGGINLKKTKAQRYIGILLTVLMILFVITGCSKKEDPRTITNTQIELRSQETMLEESIQTNSENTETLENQEKIDNFMEENEEAVILQKEQKETESKEKASDKQEKALDKQLPDDQASKASDVVEIDGVTYKGYKGPVQGEIKYQEGRPATENAKDYKASGNIESPYQINLTVTRDYGHKKIYSKNVGLVKDEVGMEVLFRNLDIQTAYGGGFVNAINGLESAYTFKTGKDRKKEDWFYWVNGILAPVGVAEYRPQAGDEIWWDYHDWNMTMFVPAVIGSYPHPFINGFLGKNPGTVILYTKEFEQRAEELKKSLQVLGVKQIDIASFDPEAIKSPKKFYILLGVWEDFAKESEIIKDVNTRTKLIGVYAKFEEGKLHGLNFNGKVISSHQQAGVIFGYGSSIGSIHPVWMVTGTDEKGVDMALDVLLNRPKDIQHHFGAIISEQGIENIPYID